MKMNRTIKSILLADAREGRAPTAQDVQKNAEAARFLDELKAVKHVMQATTPDTSVSDFAMEQIRAEARAALRRTPERKPSYLPMPSWRPAFVYASLSIVILLLGVFTLVRSPTESGTQQMTALPEITVIDAEWDSAFNDLVSTVDSSMDQLITDMDDTAWLTLSLDADELAAELLKGSDS